jgi:uncharacterized protein (TIGR04168 family)
MKLAIVGDIHGFWTDFDTDYFNQSDYDALLLTGDLRAYRVRSETETLKKLNGLQIPTYLCPGNWDSTHFMQMVGEIFQNQTLILRFGRSHPRRFLEWKKNLASVQVGGYSLHPLVDRKTGKTCSLLIGRPFSCGGPLGFRPSLEALFGVSSLEDSVNLYKSLIQTAESDDLIFLTHNGPTGLGDRATDIYGCDYRKSEGDWGDRDLEEAIRYAQSLGKQVHLVVSGHMHHQNKKTKSVRKWLVESENITYLNAAKVPRIRRSGERVYHSHFSAEIHF